MNNYFRVQISLLYVPVAIPPLPSFSAERLATAFQIPDHKINDPIPANDPQMEIIPNCKHLG